MSTDAPTVLSYSPGTSWRSREPTLIENDDAVTIVNPILPKWVPWLAIAVQLVFALELAFGGVQLIELWRGFTLHSKFHMPRELLFLSCEMFGGSVLIALFAAHMLNMHLRWGQIPRTLKMTRDSLTLSWLGFRKMRECRWKAEDVRLIELKTCKDVFTRKEKFRVKIRLRSGFPKWRLIPVRDAGLASNIYAALSKMHALQTSPGGASGAPNTSTPTSITAPLLVPPDATAVDNHYNAPE